MTKEETEKPTERKAEFEAVLGICELVLKDLESFGSPRADLPAPRSRECFEMDCGRLREKIAGAKRQLAERGEFDSYAASVVTGAVDMAFSKLKRHSLAMHDNGYWSR
jgi:hypothetical protein